METSTKKRHWVTLLSFVASFSVTLVLLRSTNIFYGCHKYSVPSGVPCSIQAGFAAQSEQAHTVRQRLGLPQKQADVGDRHSLARNLQRHDFDAHRCKADPETVRVLSEQLERQFSGINITEKECPSHVTLGQLHRERRGKPLTARADSWDRWHEGISTCASYTDDTAAALERDLATLPLKAAANNVCFKSVCRDYCDVAHAICGKPDLKEGSVQAYLPRRYETVPRKELAIWQKDQTYCEWKVKRKERFSEGMWLLDFMDSHILDFLTGNFFNAAAVNFIDLEFAYIVPRYKGNQDRHHMHMFKKVAAPIHLDNGRGFGSPRMDDLSIIMPLAQCCVIRPSTLQTLLHFYAGPVSLSRALHQSLGRDPVAPILPAKHLDALERRLGIIMQTIKRCFDTHPDPDSIITTFFEHQPGALDIA